MTEKTSCGKKTKTAVQGSEDAERAESWPSSMGPATGGAELSLRLMLEQWS